MSTDAEGVTIQAARWLAAESLRVCGQRIEGHNAAWPTLGAACAKFNVTGSGDDAVVLRTAQELRDRWLSGLPPLSGQRDPEREAAELAKAPWRPQGVFS